MNLESQVGNRRYDVAIENAVSIAIPLCFNELQPVNYGVPFAQSEPCITGNFIGDVRQGGSCNFEKYTLIPHCNGTHTECYGHLTEQRTSVHDLITVVLVPCTLISILPSESSKVIESYDPQTENNDLIISRFLLEEKLKDSTSDFFNSLVIRTMPNSIEKKTRNYDNIQAPYFSNEAMHFLNELGVIHLLVDFPSVDRAYDEGKLSNHRIWWGLNPGQKSEPTHKFKTKSITEMTYIPNNIPDGNYLLNIQIAPFYADAAPSNPVLIPVKKK